MQACFLPADILLPDAAADFEKWAVVACDQFTSQPEYWRKAAEIVGDAPSTLNLVYPEAYLAEGDARIAAIRQAMEDYMRRGVLQTRVKDGFVLVRRVTESGERLGLVGRLDLEQYDFTPGTSAPVRATEGTILSRIPPRVRIRQGASIESPHAMMLIDDAAMRLIEPLADRELPKLYDTELMLGGGHIAGYAVEGELAARTAEQIARMQAESGGFFLAVGDGNHSLATAKACWEAIKPTLSDEARVDHPARFALCELVNLHSPALIFRPVHRVVFGAEIDALQSGFERYLRAHGMTLADGGEVTLVQAGAWDRDEIRCFSDQAGRQSHVANKGRETQMRALDSVLGGRPCTYLKMDVEGAEREAISGAEQTIRTFAPKLNIAAYHRSEDFFELPLLIHSLCKDYALYLRHHPYVPAWDTNLYAR